MLINCKPGCAGKKVTTEAHLDVTADEVICEYCGDILEVSSFVKTSMKQRGDIVRVDNRKSFQFDCQACNSKVETEVVNNQLRGIGCDKGCKFNVSKFTIHAMKKTGVKVDKEDK
jgi:hypothetical protein